mmetsp:Transcript_69546/g.204110  ORF Transcript_69546/g.204110 Transcript_69546/m.204110 type:complete len:257 (-) Transcript_69546:76-846(-)
MVCERDRSGHLLQRCLLQPVGGHHHLQRVGRAASSGAARGDVHGSCDSRHGGRAGARGPGLRLECPRAGGYRAHPPRDSGGHRADGLVGLPAQDPRAGRRRGEGFGASQGQGKGQGRPGTIKLDCPHDHAERTIRGDGRSLPEHGWLHEADKAARRSGGPRERPQGGRRLPCRRGRRADLGAGHRRQDGRLEGLLRGPGSGRPGRRVRGGRRRCRRHDSGGAGHREHAGRDRGDHVGQEVGRGARRVGRRHLQPQG